MENGNNSSNEIRRITDCRICQIVITASHYFNSRHKQIRFVLRVATIIPLGWCSNVSLHIHTCQILNVFFSTNECFYSFLGKRPIASCGYSRKRMMTNIILSPPEMKFGVTPPGICKLFETKNVQAQLHLFSLSYLNQSQRQLLLKKTKCKNKSPISIRQLSTGHAITPNIRLYSKLSWYAIFRRRVIQYLSPIRVSCNINVWNVKCTRWKFADKMCVALRFVLALLLWLFYSTSIEYCVCIQIHSYS